MSTHVTTIEINMTSHGHTDVVLKAAGSGDSHEDALRRAIEQLKEMDLF